MQKLKNIRLELRNDPEIEDVIVQQEDGEWVDPEGITDYEEVPFDVFVHVAKKYELWENLTEADTSGRRARVCFNSIAGGASVPTGSGKVKILMTSSGRYSGRRCAHGVQFGHLFKIYSIARNEGWNWGGGHMVDYGRDYDVIIVSDGS